MEKELEENGTDLEEALLFKAGDAYGMNGEEEDNGDEGILEPGMLAKFVLTQEGLNSCWSFCWFLSWDMGLALDMETSTPTDMLPVKEFLGISVLSSIMSLGSVVITSVT